MYSRVCLSLSLFLPLSVSLVWIESFSFVQRTLFPNNDGARITLDLEFSFGEEYDLTRKSSPPSLPSFVKIPSLAAEKMRKNVDFNTLRSPGYLISSWIQRLFFSFLSYKMMKSRYQLFLN